MEKCKFRIGALLIVMLIGIFGLVGTFLLFGVNKTVSALSYRQDIGVSFTFNPTIRITLSSADIHIDDLAPGTVSDSNVVTVNVLTNTANGYTLNASVGNDTSFATAGRDLVHNNSTIPDKFTSVDFGSSLASNTDLEDNTWGYSFSLDGGTTWLNATKTDGTNNDTGYSGLPLYSDTTNVATLKDSTGPVNTTSGDNIKFKIAAKASNTIPSGEYGNVINFTVVATPIPKTLTMAYEDAGKEKFMGYYKMQDMTSDICDAAEVVDEGSQMQAIDMRDGKVYWITKLRNGKCFMTQNLDHDIDATRTYTPADTDIPANWVPDESTLATDDDYWSNSDTTPVSYDPGDKIYNGVPNADFFYGGPYIDLNSMNQGTNMHYHLGNYYNFSAAVAMNDTSGYVAGDTDLNQSICPAGWTLPKGGNSTDAGSFQSILEPYYAYYIDQLWDQLGFFSSLYITLGGTWAGRPYHLDFAAYGVFSSSTNTSLLSVWAYEPPDSVSAFIVPYNYKYNHLWQEYMITRGTGVSVRCVSR